ncbi:Vitamin B12 import ATP-binding protein BtuD [Sodalis praecaptivus]
MFNPDILLMDEPLGALDKNLRQSLQLQIKQLHQELGLTVVFVTHDQEEAMNLSDTIVIMDQGNIIDAGRPEHLYRRPGGDLSPVFSASAILFSRRLDRSLAYVPNISASASRVASRRRRCGRSDDGDLLRPVLESVYRQPWADDRRLRASRHRRT